MNYRQAVDYLNSFIDYEKLSDYAYNKAFGLERMVKLLELLGNPHKDLKAIHIAGTKGKGSTCAMTATILAEAGFKIGLYTSPHLEDFRERIQILGAAGSRMIEKEDVCELAERIRPAVEKLNSPERPTFFEIYTALAFLYFKKADVDFAVLEVGLGGRLDATNVVNAMVSAITSLSLEHTDKLGNTVEEIAGEKAGIIKKDGIVVTAPQDKGALDVIKARCRQCNAQLKVAGTGPGYFKDIRLSLLGRHQLTNASLAVDIIIALKNYGISIPENAIKEGLENTSWPGRLETVKRDPAVLLDGAQNKASAKALADAVGELFRYRKLILILGMSNDKDISGICGELLKIADRIIVTKSESPRAADPEAIGKIAKTTDVTFCVKDALDLALNVADKDDLILITGSLYLVGEARKVLRIKNGRIKRYHSGYIYADR